MKSWIKKYHNKNRSPHIDVKESSGLPGAFFSNRFTQNFALHLEKVKFYKKVRFGDIP
jgi:hypothetical protein